MVDLLVLETSAERRMGSSPIFLTINEANKFNIAKVRFLSVRRKASLCMDAGVVGLPMLIEMQFVVGFTYGY